MTARPRSLPARARRAWSRIWGRVPLSAAGLLAGLMAWGGLSYWGLEQSDFVIRAAGLAVLAVLAVSVIGVTLAGLVLWTHLRRAPGRVEAHHEVGHPLDTGFAVPRFRFWPLIRMDVQWAEPAAVEVLLEPDGALARERVVFGERGRPRTVLRRFAVSDVFGLAKLGFERAWPATLTVEPARATVDLTAAIRNAAGDGHAHPSGEVEGDLVEMRRYGPGDPVRLILWKAYARSRRLLVRMPERAVAPQPSTVAYFVAGEGDEPAASVARTFVEAGLLGPDFTFGADGTATPATTPEAALMAIIASAHHRSAGGEGLAGFLAAVPRERLGRCILFVPGEPGPWQAHLAAFVEALPAPPTVIASADGVLGPVADRWRWLREPPPGAGRDLRALPGLYDALRRLNAPVKVVHRSAGRVLAEAELESLRHV